VDARLINRKCRIAVIPPRERSRRLNLHAQGDEISRCSSASMRVA